MIGDEKAKHFKSAFGKTVADIPKQTDALFHSVRSALAFAYAIEHFSIVSSPSLMPATGSSGRLSCLSPHEKHAQGALIRKAAESRLFGISLAITFADHGTGEIRAAAIREVSAEVAKIVKRTGLGAELVKRNFSRNGIRKTQQELAKEFGLAQPTICHLDKLVADEIDRLRASAEQSLEQLFVATGISESV